MLHWLTQRAELLSRTGFLAVLVIDSELIGTLEITNHPAKRINSVKNQIARGVDVKRVYGVVPVFIGIQTDDPAFH
ncbi:hypothetical protein D3C80_1176040 [compost metagenome]